MSIPAESNGLRKKLDTLGVQVNDLIKEVEQNINNLVRQINNQSELLFAAVSVLGVDDVKAKMEEIRIEQKRAQEAKQIAALNELKSHNILLAQDAVDTESIVVVSETLPDGKVNREQYRISAVQDEIRPQFIGKKVGEVVEFRGVKIEITEIWLFDQARADAVQKEQAAAAEAQKAALEATPAATEPAAEAPVVTPAEGA